jgi:hypothetical protein
MKRFYLTAIILIMAIFSSVVFAEEKSVDFNWTMNDTTGVTSYKLYYSYTQNMTIDDATWHSDCQTPSSSPSGENSSDLDFAMTCNNIPITQYPVYFQIAAVTAEKETLSDIFDIVAGVVPEPPANLIIIE